MSTVRWSQRCWVGMTLLGLLAAGYAWSLSDTELSQLVMVDQNELPRLAVERIAWLPDNRHVVVGGWLQWPDTPVVAVFPNDYPAMQAGTQAAAPRFAVAPDGQSVAFWKKVRVGQQDRAELTLARLAPEMISTLGEPVEINPALHLLWLAGGPVVYGTDDVQKNAAVLWAAELTGGLPRQVIALAGTSWRELAPGPEAGQVAAITADGAYAVNPRTGQYLPLGRRGRAVPAPDGSGRTLEVDAEGALIISVSATEGAIVDRGVRAAQWRPDGQAVLFIKDRQVALASANGAVVRPLLNPGSGDNSLFLRGCCWSPDGVNIAVWGVSGATGRAWRAALGQEAITARFAFPKDAPVKAGSNVWVVAKYQTDRAGRIIEPVWSTLKAQFKITRLLRTPEGIVAEAASVGGEGGVLDRIGGAAMESADDSGHIRIGAEGAPLATAWARTRTLRFRAGLRGWLEKTPYDSEPLSINVERNLLPPIGQADK